MKINLLKNRAEGGTSKTSATEFNYEPSFESTNIGIPGESSSKEIVHKIVAMVLSVAILMIYETYNIDSLKTELLTANNENSVITTELNEKKPLAARAKVLQKEIQDLEARIKSIKDLSKIRLREIRAIDFIQNTIPEKVWLSNLDFKDGNLKIEGSAISDEQMNKFIEALEAKSYFKSVILLKAVEEKTKDGTVKRFEISSVLNNID